MLGNPFLSKGLQHPTQHPYLWEEMRPWAKDCCHCCHAAAERYLGLTKPISSQISLPSQRQPPPSHTLRCGLRSSKATTTSVKSLEPCRTCSMCPNGPSLEAQSSDSPCVGLESRQGKTRWVLCIQVSNCQRGLLNVLWNIGKG